MNLLDDNNYVRYTYISIFFTFISVIMGFIMLGDSFNVCNLITCLNVIIFGVGLCYYETYIDLIGDKVIDIFMGRVVLYSFTASMIIGTSDYGWCFSIILLGNAILNYAVYKELYKERMLNERMNEIVHMDFDDGDEIQYTP